MQTKFFINCRSRVYADFFLPSTFFRCANIYVYKWPKPGIYKNIKKKQKYSKLNDMLEALGNVTVRNCVRRTIGRLVRMQINSPVTPNGYSTMKKV